MLLSISELCCHPFHVKPGLLFRYVVIIFLMWLSPHVLMPAWQERRLLRENCLSVFFLFHKPGMLDSRNFCNTYARSRRFAKFFRKPFIKLFIKDVGNT